MAGRPLKFNNCLDLDAACCLYFEHCTDEKEHPTVSGLACHLDVDRKTITNYQNRDEFFPTIKRAKAQIEAYLEQMLYGNSVTGVIFNLKNNFEWKDRVEQEISGPDNGPVKTENKTIFEFIVPECKPSSQ